MAMHEANCKDETLDAPELNAMKNMMEPQSNNGDGNDGDRFVSSNVGKKKELLENRHLRVNGLNAKNLKVEEKLKERKRKTDPYRSMD